MITHRKRRRIAGPDPDGAVKSAKPGRPPGRRTAPPAPECATYSVPEAAKLLGVGRNQGYDAARRKEIPTIRVGKSLRVPKQLLHQMLGL
jgi:excisionase family DNA binding protein